MALLATILTAPLAVGALLPMMSPGAADLTLVLLRLRLPRQGASGHLEVSEGLLDEAFLEDRRAHTLQMALRAALRAPPGVQAQTSHESPTSSWLGA